MASKILEQKNMRMLYSALCNYVHVKDRLMCDDYYHMMHHKMKFPQMIHPNEKWIENKKWWEGCYKRSKANLERAIKLRDLFWELLIKLEK